MINHKWIPDGNRMGCLVAMLVRSALALAITGAGRAGLATTAQSIVHKRSVQAPTATDLWHGGICITSNYWSEDWFRFQLIIPWRREISKLLSWKPPPKCLGRNVVAHLGRLWSGAAALAVGGGPEGGSGEKLRNCRWLRSLCTGCPWRLRTW